MSRLRSASLLAALALAPTAGAQTVVVTPGNPQGWTATANATSFTGITGDQPRGTPPQNTGSLEISGTDGVQGIRTRYGLTVANPLTDSFGYVGNLVDFGFEWYRSSSSTVAGIQAPAFRLHTRTGTGVGAVFGELIWEYTYNGPGNAPVDAWQTVSTNLSNGIFWYHVVGSGQQGAACTPGSAYQTLAAWVSTCAAGAEVIGISAGVGTIPGTDGQTFLGYADNISLQFHGQSQATLYNFEVSAVPEPSTYALMASGLAFLGGVAARRRRVKG